jgi:antibiotic biosynthesis monooxygenase (ABM) superfamily enzyme
MERTSTPNQAAAGPRVPPPRHKMALLTWAGAWAMITLILSVLGPVIATWPLPLQTLVVSVLMVLALTWVVIPTLTRVFAVWLAPAPTAANRQDRDHETRHRRENRRPSTRKAATSGAY